MKAVIIEDEEIIARVLVNTIKKVDSSIDVVEIIPSLKVARKWFGVNAEPDILFMDIQLSDGVSFDLLEHFSLRCPIIFTTAYDEYALKAFEYNALDYILKPIDLPRLSEAIHRVFEEFDRKHEHDSIAERKMLGENDQVFIKDGEKCWFVKLSDIRLFESEGNYVRVYFETSRPLILRSLNSLETRLNEKHFFRASRKHMINLSYIASVETWFNGGLNIKMKDGKEVEVSRRQAVRLKDLMSL